MQTGGVEHSLGAAVAPAGLGYALEAFEGGIGEVAVQ